MGYRSDYCSCGLLAQNKAGTEPAGDGLRKCRRCGLVTWESFLANGGDPGGVEDLGPDVPAHMVTTLDFLPGYRVVKTLGVVSEVGSHSGFTATTKGSNALEKAVPGLFRQASSMRGNAILGLRVMPFGAGGGITNALGGDAVGVVLLGTVALVEPEAAAE